MMATKLVSRKPKGGTPKRWEFPRFTKDRIGSGLQVIAAHAPGRPLAAAQLLLEAGPSNESDDQTGIAYLTARALTEGTERYKGSAFVQAFERLGADIFATCDYDSFSVNLRAPIDRLEPALELLAEAVLRPAFAGNDLDRLKKERLGGILQEYANPSSRVAIAFNKAVYADGSLYSRSALGDYWSVAQLAKGKVKKYYERFATPGSATLIVSGDLEGFPLVKIAEKLFGGWKGNEPDHPVPEVSGLVDKSFVLVVDKPEAEQSELEIGHIGVPRSSRDYFPLLAFTTALGGMFSSRLSMRLREEKGFTYGIRAGFDFRRQAGPFRVRTAVDTNKTVEAVAEIIEVLETTKQKGITKSELEEVKGLHTGSFPLMYETPESIASGLSSLVTFDLPDDYFDTYRTNIEKVTLDQANEAAQHIRPDQLAIVLVGDAEVVRDPLVDAEFGPVAMIEDPEPGNPPNE